MWFFTIFLYWAQFYGYGRLKWIMDFDRFTVHQRLQKLLDRAFCTWRKNCTFSKWTKIYWISRHSDVLSPAFLTCNGILRNLLQPRSSVSVKCAFLWKILLEIRTIFMSWILLLLRLAIFLFRLETIYLGIYSITKRELASNTSDENNIVNSRVT